MSTPLVEFNNVVKRFGDSTAVERMSFEIGKGEFLAIMGSSGCGKTTTLRMLAGLDAPYVLPDVPSNEFLNLEGRKFNTSSGWYISIDEFLETYPADTLRWTLTRRAPEKGDSEFTFEKLAMRMPQATGAVHHNDAILNHDGHCDPPLINDIVVQCDVRDIRQ